MKNQYTARLFYILVIFSMLLSAVGMPTHIVKAATSITFTAEELLGKPQDTSITINIVPASTIEYHYQYGLTSGANTWSTPNVTATGGQPHEVVISGLTANTQYFYRMQYHLPGEGATDWVNRTEHSFQTQRAKGSSFTFAVTSDSHAQFNTNHQQTMTNINTEHPDFLIDLGDTFYTDNTTGQSAVDQKYLAYRAADYMGKIGPSVPIFLSSGNHENEEGWNLDDTPFSIALGSIQARKAYFPTPVTGGIYTGNTNTLATIDASKYGDQLREDYYAWTWGDALFVVIDEFQYTMNIPYAAGSPGEGTDDTMSGDQWNWTLGAQQFQWFKQTLQTSTAKYKFVFSHQMLGGIPNLTISGVGPGYVRGGGGAAPYFEWGGANGDGTAGFASHRNPADFGTETIHQLMVENGVSAYFHGHDHQYVYEKTDDGIVYQEVPSPSMSGSGFSGIYSVGDHGTYETIAMKPSTGHLLVTVNPTQSTVDYVRSSTTIDYTYTIAPSVPAVTHNLTVNVSPSGAGTTSPAGTTAIAKGSSVTVTATANTGYTFSSWSGDCTGSGACSVTMDGDKTVTATFTTVPTYVLTTAVSPSGGGTINPAAGTHTYNSGTVVSVTATPNTGYAFSSWSGGTCSGSGTCSVTMNAAKSVTANFSASATPITFTGTELLGRPEATSISVSVVPDAAISLYYEWGTTSGSYTAGGLATQTTAASGTPKVVTMSGLSPNTKYYYRMQYSTNSGASWVARPEKSFWTQRAAGSTFSFDITTDSHINIMLGNASNWTSTLNGVAADNPDFLLDLGDTFAMDNGTTSVALGDTAAAEQKYKDALPSFNIVSGSAPIFLVPGNHEQQEAWHLQGTLANSLPVMSKNAEKKFFLNPVPNSFYTGDTSTYAPLGGDQLKQDYYAWTWGDALFVVISPFWTTTTKPYTTSTGGGETDATGSGNRWDWTLGVTQYNWLQTTLSGSSAKYKFVFAHQIVGGNSMTNQVNYGHGGVDSANLVEWGGNDVGGSTSTWATNRPSTAGWGTQPIGPLLVSNHVTAFFHGHDHQAAHESLNGVVYQAVPSGSFTGSFGGYTTGGNSGNTIWADSTQGPGHLKVTVSPTQTTVDFIRYNASTAVNSYTMAPYAGTTYNLAVTNAGSGIGTVTSAPTGINCGATCSASFAAGSTVTLTAAASTGSTFSGWSGAGCSGTGTCSVTMSAAQSVTATFTLNTYLLTVNKPGAGAGTVTSAPTGINCGATCSASFNYNTNVVLTAAATTGSTFNGWTGNAACSGTGTCTIPMTAVQSVTATFSVTNVAPVAAADTYTAQKNTPMTISAPGVLSNDTDTNLDTLTASKVTDPLNGVLTLNANGSFTYTPTTAYTGDDSFTYRAYDGALYSTAATVTIHINDATPPVVPSSFHGEIHLTPSPDAGDYVEAYVPGAAGYVARTAITGSTPLIYAIDVPGDITGTSVKEGGVEGDVITFKINTSVVGKAVWHSGTSVRLDFTTITHTISLVSGWNLVSFNVLPNSTAIADVLATLGTSYDLVYAWNAAGGSWLKYDRTAGYGNTLDNLDESMGFWIRMTTAGTLTISGSAPSTTNIALKTGWNLVGFPASTNLALPEALSSHGVTDFSLVYAYHAGDTADPWKKHDTTAPFGNDLTELAPGWGYWIKVGGTPTWVVGY